MKKLILFSAIILIIVSTGCSAKLEYMPSKSKYSPKNSKEEVGIVSYLNQGADFIVKSRKEDAYKIMFEACNGNYSIIDTSANTAANGFYNVTTSSFSSFSENRIYIKFKCN